MADTIRVEVARRCDARGVLDALGTHGLTATLVEVNGSWEIDIAGDDEVEVGHALDDWAADRGVPFVAMKVGERRLAVRPPGD